MPFVQVPVHGWSRVVETLQVLLLGLFGVSAGVLRTPCKGSRNYYTCATRRNLFIVKTDFPSVSVYSAFEIRDCIRVRVLKEKQKKSNQKHNYIKYRKEGSWFDSSLFFYSSLFIILASQEFLAQASSQSVRVFDLGIWVRVRVRRGFCSRYISFSIN